MRFTRRELLAGIGLGTLGTYGTTLSRGQPRYTHYTYAADGDPDDRRIRVAWYERYNGVFQETQAGTDDPGFDTTLDPDSAPEYVTEATFVTDVEGPVLTVGNVLPGDRGTLVVGIEVADDDTLVPEPVDVWLRAGIDADTENGINGPEQAAGDTSGTNGELDDELVVELWRDGAPLGSCNGRRDFTEALEGSIVEPAPVSVAFGPASDVGDADGRRVLTSLDPGQSRCIAVQWTLPIESATNRSQGDGVVFDLRFGAVPVDGASPFADAEVGQ